MSAPLVIETGIPIPSRGRKHTELYTALKMLEPTQSILIPEGYSDSKSDLASLVYSWARSAGLKGKFVTRKVEGGHRVWRL